MSESHERGKLSRRPRVGVRGLLFSPMCLSCLVTRPHSSIAFLVLIAFFSKNSQSSPLAAKHFWIAGRSDVEIKLCQSTGTIVHAVGVRSDVLIVRGHSRFLRSLSTGEVNALHFCDIRLDDGRTLVSSHFIPRFVCIPSGFLRVWISVALHCDPGHPKVCCGVVDIPVDSCEVLLCHERDLLAS